MLIDVDPEATAADLLAIESAARARGLTARTLSGSRPAMVVTGEQGAQDPAAFRGLPGVRGVRRLDHGYELCSRDARREDTVVFIGEVPVGGPDLVVIGGPCAVESRAQTIGLAARVKAAGAHVLRGGAFKPRTSPYSFQGLGEEGLKILAEARAVTGLPVVTEAMDLHQMDLVLRYADAVQIGARNMQNFPLLTAAGQAHKPVLLKRGMQATLEELLLAAEYILAEGNPDVILCERGIRAFSDFTRNTLDLAVVPAAKKLTHLPVIVDPSHASGREDLVLPLARAAVAAGADGLMVEVHGDPSGALCDGAESVTPEAFSALMTAVARVADSVDRPLLTMDRDRGRVAVGSFVTP